MYFTQGKLAGRRDRRLAEERRAAEEAAAKLFLDEQTTQMATTRVVKEGDETFKAPEVKYGAASVEEQALKKQHVGWFALKFWTINVTKLVYMYVLLLYYTGIWEQIAEILGVSA